MHQSLHEVLDLTAQMDKLTQSLSGSGFAGTPISGSFLLFLNMKKKWGFWITVYVTIDLIILYLISIFLFS